MKIFLLAFSFILFGVSNCLSQDVSSDNSLLKKIDEMRSPQGDYKVGITITSIKPDRENKISTIEVWARGLDDALIKTLSPESDRGRVMLMKGHNMWIYLQTISKPIRLSLRERFMGEVSNADIARANFSADYKSELLNIEKIGDKDYQVVRLSANSADIAYAKVILWVDKVTLSPFQAQFYGLSGKLLKTCKYENFKEFGGRIRPTRLVMIDPINSGRFTIIDYDDPKMEPLEEKYFTESYMQKITE